MTELLEFLKAVVQGIVQGITEWLPVSSTGHLLLFNQFMPFENKAFFDVFKVLIQLGSILAVVVLYFHKLNPFSPKKSSLEKRDTWSLWAKVLVASIPAGVVGAVFSDEIDGVLSMPPVIAGALIFYGMAFIWMESRNRQPQIHNFKELNYKTALFIGIFQMLALIPGTSRSGSTILGAVLLGCSRFVSAEFSFFMAIPAMFGGSAIKLLMAFQDGVSFTALEWGVMAVGMLVAFLVSLLVIRFFMDFIKKHDFKVFGYYRIVLGVAILLLCLVHVLEWDGVYAL